MIGSLFSGIGGLELGLEWAGLGPVAWQVEIDPFCRRVLSAHWPDATRHEDVTKVGRNELTPVDVVCGGFPCQDISSAGKGAGLAGSRSGLWFEFARIIGELQPRWVVVENVASGAKRWVDQVCAHLGQLGYAALSIPLSAQDVGAPHIRRRVFIVAHSGGARLEVGKVQPVGEELAPAGGVGAGGDASYAKLHPIRNGAKRRSTRWTGRIQREGKTITVDHGKARDAPRANGEGKPTQPVDGQVEGMRETPGDGWWLRGPTVPPVCRVDDGVSHRMDRLRALGNAVVPQCAEVIGWVIRELENGQ